MIREIRALKSARDLFRTSGQFETVLAVVIVAIVVGPFLYREMSGSLGGTQDSNNRLPSVR